jgi:hypothetical protein
MVNLPPRLILGLCAVQVISGTFKTTRCWLPVLLLVGGVQLCAAATVGYNTLSRSLGALFGGGAGPELSDVSAYLYTGGGAVAIATTLIDVCIALAYVRRGVRTDDARAAAKVLTVFSMAGAFLVLASFYVLGFGKVKLVDVVDLSDTFMDKATIICLVALGIAAVGLTVLCLILIVNWVSSVGNRRFAFAWFLWLFLVHLPASVIWGVASITGANDDLGGFLYIFITSFLPMMSLSYTLSKESFVLERYKNGEEYVQS